jgi:hypothetical protein
MKGRMRDSVRDDYMLVGIHPLLSGQDFGLGSRDISDLILSTRLQGFTLYPITQWPVTVYVTRILDESIVRSMTFNSSQVELIAWGQLLPTLEEAEKVANQLSPGRRM